ncbi:MAG: hypothetical protein AB8C95_08260 [Phycisphaeraceae bacterium]
MDLRSMSDKRSLERRQEKRQPYRNIARIIVSLCTFDGMQQQFKVRAYDLSPSGLGFLHGAFLYSDTPAEILMQHHVYGMTRIPATIVSSVHVKGRIHLCGAKFAESIDLNDYLMSEAG